MYPQWWEVALWIGLVTLLFACGQAFAIYLNSRDQINAQKDQYQVEESSQAHEALCAKG